MMATRKPRRFNEGDLVSDKEAGLKASAGEKVGLLERLRMGNIDQEGSEAYNRFGAGRGKAERTKANQSTSGAVSPNVYRVDSGPGSLNVEDDSKPSTNVHRVDSGPGKMSSGSTKVTPARKPAVKTTSAPATQAYTRKMGATAEEVAKPYTRKMGATAEEVAKPYTRKMGATAEEMAKPYNYSAYKPRRTPESLSSTRKPGTNTNYENKEATSETFKKGGAVRGWGMARGARKAKIV
jgi:hypothetical protein